ncbi:MAG: hypothetical protein E6772_09360 [Dysgonomonas sp.]|nr:hypothetical protein [Dysgonomonas sp.]
MKKLFIFSLLCLSITNLSSQMKKAYDVSGYMVKERLANEDLKNEEIIADVSESDLVVVDGTYDHIHLVLSSLTLPHTRISQDQLSKVHLKPHQTVFVNCAGGFPADGACKLSQFVAEGGQLITTDWALRSVLEAGFPGYVAYNERPTGDEVVRVEVMDKDDSVINGFLDEKTAPVWWLEGSSYPIKVLNTEKVTTLIKSKELKDRYGEEAVLVRFNHGKGVVYHMISHFYLQRTETKDAKQKLSAGAYLEDKNSVLMNNEVVKEQLEKLDYGTVQSANTSSEFIMRAVINQKKKNNVDKK